MTTKLTAKQARFVEEYLGDLNATQAAIRAGYSPKTAMGITICLLPVGVAAAAAPAIITVAATRNAGYVGALFFVLVGAVGGWYHQDWTGTAGVALIAAAVAIKSWRQYRWL
ncbi:MAG: terminase small subunit [SAR202 cluster bacterium]|jgi:hypothetical protein|nr:terminase small subunit [SAR202 cluster bacterium]